MDIKQYIDYFKEISHLKREQQFSLLEQACNEVNSNANFPILVIIPYVIRLIFILIFVGGSYLAVGYSSWIFALTILLSLLCSRVVTTEIKDSLILKALKKYLSHD